MPSHRIPRVAEAIREVVSSAILFEMSDPRVQGVTVLRVEVTGDLRHAKVFVTVMGTETQQRLSLRGLENAAGFLQSKVAKRLQTRFTPILTFELDDSVKKSVAISKIIDEAIASDRKPAAPGDEDETEIDDVEDGDEADDDHPDDEDEPDEAPPR